MWNKFLSSLDFSSMGALLELNDRGKLEQYFLDCHDVDIPKNIAQGGSLFDYLVNDNGQWGNRHAFAEIC